MRSLTIIGICGIFLMGCSSQPTSQNYTPAAVPIFVADVVDKNVPLYIESIGTLNAAAIVEIRPQVNGILKEIHFFEGQDVKKDDLLFTIDLQSYQIKLQEAEALLKQTKATADASSKKLERYKSLSNKDLIPQQEWDELLSQVAKNEAQVMENEAKVASSALDLQRCMIKAPMDGRVGKVAVHSGNLVSASQQAHLVVLSNINDLSVEFTLTEREFQQLNDKQIHENLPIEICTLCHGKEAAGFLSFLDHKFDLQTGLLHIHGVIQNPQRHFLPGQSVKVRLPIATLLGAKLVPQKAVKINQQGPYVYVVKEDSTVEIRQIHLGDEFEDKVIVLEGISPGEQIVTDGHLRLSPGTKVEIKTDTGSL